MIYSKDKVLETYEKIKNLELKEYFLERASEHSFYNTSKYDFQKLLNDSENIEINFREYLNNFSENVQNILSNFDFDSEILNLLIDMLYLIIEEFNESSLYLGT